jgi:excisionase family DNA binding protein
LTVADPFVYSPSCSDHPERGRQNVEATASPLLTPLEIARRLRVHQDTVHAWIRNGVPVAGRLVKLSATRVGWRWRITEDELRAFVRACNPEEEGAPPEQPPAARAATRELRKRLAKGR